ncbi:hypothetical protein N7448_001924 [Penicillium atrosanguineum]|uniref:histidine kinase n=1 Tax=Penicillium atrosanguineum TaxID=1132637 RepID=A0A9W9PWA7_9EURO|nr:uncharacterized protein N7443_005325 [Penicillium atrosanguineum]KAJ5128207.1 hypothetical protein N7526_006373 [Penicillium atrosanguineum]KAJ5144532.1 hypothetical protein N7448_001924 [Penicillium atrosanguineum]KAJ5300323.1 hypothetical protein N7443_005325 [Penicillium atrosanguineum]KAJ5310963.1 hypothetical protein N7476_006823 [Penicillium atrosanguineum]
MRVPIAVQLGLLVLLTTVVGIAVLAVATWTTTYDFVVNVKAESLELVATIKASQIASNLDLLEVTSKTISTRLLVQSALNRYYNGNTSTNNWVNSIADVQSALGSRGYLDLYQAVLFARSGEVAKERLLSVTSETVPDIVLPYTYANGSEVLLGSDGAGYPPSLYPNLTYTTSASDDSVTVHAFPDYPLGLKSALLLGPLRINNSFSLVSLTLPIVNNTSDTDLLGFMTIVASAANVQDVITSRDGLGNTGQVLLIGPSRAENTFAFSAQPATATSAPKAAGLADAEVHYVFEPTPLPGQSGRHSGLTTDSSWQLSRYKMALKLMLEPFENENKSISELSTTNEKGYSVAVGAVRPDSSLVQWILIVEETHQEAFSPVTRLRKIILACVFGTAGLVILMVPILTHFAVAPIRRLRAAAQKSVKPEIPVQPFLSRPDRRDSHTTEDIGGVSESMEEQVNEKGGPAMWAKRLRAPLERLNSSANLRDQGRPRLFQIPGRVKERNHCVTDELTELTKTFNEMSDELTIQYTRLEERVAERTRELEKAKLAAETANESKTLFIANISHELKTPLNGILGMCAVCMGEDDLSRIKKSLQVVYQSGDLLLHLLNDLLTFSKNQIEQAIQLEEKEFKISDIRSQIAIIFQNQVHEKQIDFSVNCISVDNSQLANATLCLDEGAEGTTSVSHPENGNLMNMVLWGDQHRILQVLINLVSNSLKFTPENGRVQVRIRCVEDDSGSAAPTTARRISRFQALNRLNTRSSAETTAEPRESLSDGRQLMFYFEVEDNGPGIPAHLHRRIFDPFVQGDLGLNRKYGGTGLGLSICAQLSRIMGGAIVLDSEEGRGSTFTLRIPLKFVKQAPPSTFVSSSPGSRTPSVLSLEDLSHAARTPSNHGSLRGEQVAPGFEKSDIQPRLVGLSQPFFTPTIPSSPSSTPSKHITPNNGQPQEDESKKVRVLVAEDNSVNQEVVRRMLALEEVYNVTMVKDGQEAYDTVKSSMEKGQVFDLIFMDIQMPNLDGLQSTRLIREMGYSAPIVALSAFAEESNIKDCMDSGMDMFISKPIRRPALKQVLNKFATIPEESETGPCE